MCGQILSIFFFFNDTATTEIYTLPYTTLFRSRRALHGLRPERQPRAQRPARARAAPLRPRSRQEHEADRDDFARTRLGRFQRDRKSTRLNSSHANISYAVFCLKKKKINTIQTE